MKIEQTAVLLKDINDTYKQDSKAGKCYKFKRVLILKTKDGFSVVSLNIFERFIKTLIGNKCYFSMKKLQNVKILKTNELISTVAKRTLDPSEIKVNLGIGHITKVAISVTLQDIMIAAQDWFSGTPNKDPILEEIYKCIQLEAFQQNPEKYVNSLIKKPSKTNMDHHLLDFFCGLVRDRDTNTNFPWNKKIAGLPT